MTKPIDLKELAASMEIAAQQLRDTHRESRESSVPALNALIDRHTMRITMLESNIHDLEGTITARNETLHGWQTSHAGILKERDQWAARFKGLEADMRGTMVALEQEREQVKLLKKSNQHVGLANDDLVREAEMYKKTDAYLREQISEKTKENCALYDKVKAFESGEVLPKHYKKGTEVWVVNKYDQTMHYTKVISIEVQVLSDSKCVYYNVEGKITRVSAECVYDSVLAATKYMKGEK